MSNTRTGLFCPKCWDQECTHPKSFIQSNSKNDLEIKSETWLSFNGSSETPQHSSCPLNSSEVSCSINPRIKKVHSGGAPPSLVNPKDEVRDAPSVICDKTTVGIKRYHQDTAQRLSKKPKRQSLHKREPLAKRRLRITEGFFF